jgi:hypothetical protein
LRDSSALVPTLAMAAAVKPSVRKGSKSLPVLVAAFSAARRAI